MHLEHRYDRLWERLLSMLDTLGEVDASTPGRLKLVIEGHHVELVMTEREWDDLVSTINGSFLQPAAELLRTLDRARGDEAPYVVYDMYGLHVCATPEPPVRAQLEKDRQEVDAFLRANPGAQPEWHAFRPGEEPS